MRSDTGTRDVLMWWCGGYGEQQAVGRLRSGCRFGVCPV
jgi:hypothetical protein